MLATISNEAKLGHKNYILFKSVGCKKVLHMGHGAQHKHTLKM